MRKKLILLFVASISVATTTFAQQKNTTDVFKKYRFGLFAGPTFNSMKPTSATVDSFTVSKTGGKTGFSFGISAEYNFNERYTAFTGIGMDWRGGKILAALPSTVSSKEKYVRSADIKYRTQYLTIPIGLKMTAAEFDKIKIQALAGFDFALLLSQKGDYKFITENKDSLGNYNGKYTTSSMQKVGLNGYATVVPVSLGWFIGVGGEYDLNGKNAVMAQLIYRNGFTDVTTPKLNNEGAKFSDGNIRSNTFAIRIGYTF